MSRKGHIGRNRKRRRGRRKRKLVSSIGLLVGVVIILGGVSFLASAAMSGLSGTTSFTVEEVRFEGIRYLDPGDLIELTQLRRLTTETVSAEDLEVLGQMVSAHPMVERVTVHRSLPASVIIEIEELVPIAFLAESPVRGVDAGGRILDELEILRYGALPFITCRAGQDVEEKDVVIRAVIVLEKLREIAPRLLDRVSEVQPRDEGEIALLLSGDAVTVRLGEPYLDETLPLVEALVKEGHARHAPLAEVDLRYKNTVIYRERKGGG